MFGLNLLSVRSHVCKFDFLTWAQGLMALSSELRLERLDGRVDVHCLQAEIRLA